MIIKKLLIYSYKTKGILKEYKFNDFGLNIILGERTEEGRRLMVWGKPQWLNL